MSEFSQVLVATDSDHLYNEIIAGLDGDHQMLRVNAGATVLEAVKTYKPEAIVLDMQIGNMGGIATCLNLRLEQRAGRIGLQRVILLLDREADKFIGQKSEADAWIIKPVDPLNLKQTVDKIMANEPV